MNGDRYFEEIEVGDTYRTPGRTITETHLSIYNGLIGEHHPMHADREAARESERSIGARVIPAYLNVSIAVHLGPGRNDRATPRGFDRIRFTNPVGVGDTIRAEWEVIEKTPESPERGIVTRRAEVYDQDDDLVVVFRLRQAVERRDDYQ